MAPHQGILIFLLILLLKPPQISSAKCTPTGGRSPFGDNFAQVAFVFDRNQDAVKLKPGFMTTVQTTMSFLDNHYKGSEIAVISQGQFSTGKPETCYHRVSSFETNVTYIMEQIDAVEALPDGGGKYSPLSAVCLAAQDYSLGWLRGKKDDLGRLVRRLIVFYAVQDNHFELGPPDGSFLDYGELGCDLIASLNLASVRGILRNKEVAVLGVYQTAAIKEAYDFHFITLSVPYCSVSFDDDSEFAGKLTESVQNCLNKIAEYPED